jgi:hypothetical protein
MLGDSPNSPDGLTGNYALGPVAEEDEAVLGFEEMPRVAVPMPPRQLAGRLGVIFHPESPLQEKKLEPNVMLPVADTDTVKATIKGGIFHPDPKRLSAKEKGKARPAEPDVNGNGHPRMKALTAIEKENSTLKPNGKVFSAPGGVTKISPSGSGAGEIKKSTTAKPPAKLVTSTSTSRAKPSTKVLPSVKGGPRRVLVDSVHAPVLGRGWRG